MGNICYLSLGSNLKYPIRQLKLAIIDIKTIPNTSILKKSSFYFNKALGRKNQPYFYNMAIALFTFLSPIDLLFFCQNIENRHIRIRKIKDQSRTMDIDILLYGSFTIRTKNLVIPHPKLYIRDFVLIPLQEIYNKKIY